MNKSANNSRNRSHQGPFILSVRRYKRSRRFRFGGVSTPMIEILVEDEDECKELAREEVKKVIIQMTKREGNDQLDEWTDKYIRLSKTL